MFLDFMFFFSNDDALFPFEFCTVSPQSAPQWLIMSLAPSANEADFPLV